MPKKEGKILRELNMPWITKNGYLDWTKFPIDSVLKQAISLTEQDFQSACRILTSMYSAGRFEAGIFLFGLLIHNSDDIARKESIVEALGYIETKETTDLLFRELRRTVSSNSTRKYIDRILKSLKRFPLEFIEDGFEGLLKDDRWSYRMKKKFREILEGVRYPDWG
jgi:hypothetical protein